VAPMTTLALTDLDKDKDKARALFATRHFRTEKRNSVKNTYSTVLQSDTLEVFCKSHCICRKLFCIGIININEAYC
jgi:hypothetical protein